jgi:DNA-binding PadR family transcriptional regulator
MERSTFINQKFARRVQRKLHEKEGHMSYRNHITFSEGSSGGRRGRGPGGPRGHGHPGRHRARRGAIRNAVLTLLAEQPMHGYELITELESRSEGRWRPSPGAMYPALARMEEHGLVASEELDGKRQFSLTEAGHERLAEFLDSQDDDAAAPWEDSGTGGRGDLRRSVAELMGQARQLGRFGTAAQIDRATEVFADAKRKLYTILAEEPDENSDDT